MQKISTKAEIMTYKKELLRMFRELYLHMHNGDDAGHKEYMKRTRLQDKPIGYLEVKTVDMIIRNDISWNNVVKWAYSVEVSDETLDELYLAVTKSAAERACVLSEDDYLEALPEGVRMYISDELFNELWGNND